jgi:hypothetical protein
MALGRTAPADRASFAWRLPSFDHLVGAGEQREGRIDAQRLCSLEIPRYPAMVPQFATTYSAPRRLIACNNSEATAVLVKARPRRYPVAAVLLSLVSGDSRVRNSPRVSLRCGAE